MVGKMARENKYRLSEQEEWEADNFLFDGYSDNPFVGAIDKNRDIRLSLAYHIFNNKHFQNENVQKYHYLISFVHYHVFNLYTESQLRILLTLSGIDYNICKKFLFNVMTDRHQICMGIN